MAVSSGSLKRVDTPYTMLDDVGEPAYKPPYEMYPGMQSPSQSNIAKPEEKNAVRVFFCARVLLYVLVSARWPDKNHAVCLRIKPILLSFL